MAAFAVVEGFRCGTAAALLPAAVAWDVIWPAYTAQLYATITTDLYPWQMPWRYIVLRQLVPILGIAYAVIGMVLAARRGVEAIPKMGVLTLALFYGVASLKYFGHTHVFLQYAWMLMVPTILLYDLAGRRARYSSWSACCRVGSVWATSFTIRPRGRIAPDTRCRTGTSCFLPGWTILPCVLGSNSCFSNVGESRIPDLRIPS